MVATAKRTSTDVYFELMPASNDEASLCWLKELAVSSDFFFVLQHDLECRYNKSALATNCLTSSRITAVDGRCELFPEITAPFD